MLTHRSYGARLKSSIIDSDTAHGNGRIFKVLSTIQGLLRAPPDTDGSRRKDLNQSADCQRRDFACSNFCLLPLQYANVDELETKSFPRKRLASCPAHN